ncbi:hypothetical protein GYMLUDRAFT_135482, partial [Collybiopsis luxurians FD-317 M1]
SFHGYVKTRVDALQLLYAAHQGIIPRITRRLDNTERHSMIKSGAVFIFCGEESGIKRWTDGLLWSSSRIDGDFRVYREISQRAGSRGGYKKAYSGQAASNSPRLTSENVRSSNAQSGNYQGIFKPKGLMKK